ncbi:MAG: hypothetical protein DPW18_10990 [Chloroflexi bacterium]|nr:hypothetical protein [Chloroflexota bacterium]MDL1944206.1 hypothetical protein [Chloroflexi bacterium CFX2]
MHYSPLPYLDPGSGSIIIQLALAALLGLGVFVRSQWTRIKKMFGIKPKQTDENEENDDVEKQ